MTKLHELLAADNSLSQQAQKVIGELQTTFEKRRHLFEEKRTVFRPFAEGEKEVVETQSDIQSTVPKELVWVSAHIAKALDVEHQIAVANTQARADVVLDDGTVLLQDVPATNLLELEKRLAALKTLAEAIPTLDPSKGFTVDSSRQDVFIAREVTKVRTRKTTEVIIKYPHTPEHPAQTELVSVDKPIGELREQEWSGLITPARKSDLLNRIDIVARAVRQARSRANDVEVDTSKKLGKKLFEFVLHGGR